MKFKPVILLFALISSVVLSCDYQKQNSKQKMKTVSKKEITRINKYLIEKDEQVIKKYAARRGWDLKKTKSGLWYMIDKAGQGKHINKGDEVTISYVLALLDGTVCYDSEKDGNKKIVIGSGNIESGLQDGLLLLKKGSQAIFILPPHLAHGLLGDTKRIPARATIVYDIKIIQVKPANK